MLTKPVVSIVIPCFNQPIYLKRCLNSICTQSYKNIEIILVDDNSTISYNEVLKEFAGVNIVRKINDFNLGAVPNMIYCIKLPVNSKYKIVFHEDDVMFPNLIEESVKGFDLYGNIGWVGSRMCFFKDEFEIKFEKKIVSHVFFKDNIKDLVSQILEGKTLSLTSILYNTEYTKFVNFNLEKFSMLGDRQMLFELGKQFGCSFIDTDLVFAFNHHGFDTRWKDLKKIHIVNYFTYIKSLFSNAENESNFIKAGITRGIVENCNLLVNKRFIYLFYIRCFFKRLISVKYLLLCNKFFRNSLNKFYKN